MLSLNFPRIVRSCRSGAALMQYSTKNLTQPKVTPNLQQPKTKGIVATAFEKLKEESPGSSKPTIDVDEAIVKAKDVTALLSLQEKSTLERKHALKIVSKLAEWSSENKVKLSDFENDQRFIKICSALGRPIMKNQRQNHPAKRDFRSELNTVLGVAGDDEAARLISSISLPQMVKVFSTLAQRKRRSTPILRSLAFNVINSKDSLDLKQSADILFAVAALNFHDADLFARIARDIKAAYSVEVEKSSAVGSILTSLGLLKYRDTDLLDASIKWYLQKKDICRRQDVTALLMTLATLNYKPSNLTELLSSFSKTLAIEEFSKKAEWLNHIWTLALLEVVDNSQLQLVLNETFTCGLVDEHSSKALQPNMKMKLLNLNAYAKLLAKDFKGPFLPESSHVFEVPIAHSKSKQVITNSMLDAFKSLVLSGNNVKSLVNTNMGFLIDAVCAFDDKRNPVPIDQATKSHTKIAVMVHDYHEICNGPNEIIGGLPQLYLNLLEKSGYKILTIPFKEFSSSEKLLKRVQYLEAKLKTIIVK